MKISLKSLLVLTLINVLISAQFSYSENDLIGIWKVKTVIKKSGRREKGEKILSFYEDKTFVSKDIESSRIRNGSWSYNPETKQLTLQMEGKEKPESLEIIKLTAKQLVVTIEGKTIKCVRIVDEKKG